MADLRPDNALWITPAVVYYLGDPPSQTVKIGTSTRLVRRFEALKAKWPELRLLAVEPGHFDVERVRHGQFAHWRVSHRGALREWYSKSDPLMSHINELRAQYGEPWRWAATRQKVR